MFRIRVSNVIMFVDLLRLSGSYKLASSLKTNNVILIDYNLPVVVFKSL